MKALKFFLFACICSLSCSNENIQNENYSFHQFTDEEFQLFLNTILEESKGKPNSFNQYLSQKEAFQDLQILKHVLEEANTSLYLYSSKRRIDSLFNSFIIRDSDSISYFQFTKNLAVLFSEIGCMHSGWGHPDAYKAFRTSKLKFLPLELKIIDHQLFIYKNYSLDSNIKLGSRIVEINNQSSEELIDELKKYMISDADNPRIKERAVSDYFPMAYSNFIAKPDSFKLILDQELEREVSCNALSKYEIDSIKNLGRGKILETKNKALHFEVLEEDKIAVFTISSFNNTIISHFNQNFVLFTDSVFLELKKEKIENLIIDIRGNFGGWTGNGKHLFSYFIDDSTAYIESVYSKKQRDFSFSPILKSSPEYADSMLFVNGYWTNYPNLWAYPQINGYQGKTIVIIDENSKSCSSIFSSLMKEHEKAVFIGSETGGAECGSNGMTCSISLPHSNIGITFSTALYKTAIAKISEEGVKPDIAIKEDPKSLLNNNDSILNFAIEKIRKL